MHDERVEFKPPDGVVPEDVTAGDTFDLVSTYRVKPDGQVCLIQIGDAKMPGYEEDEYNDKSHETRKSYGDMVDSMHSAMSSDNPGEGGGY